MTHRFVFVAHTCCHAFVMAGHSSIGLSCWLALLSEPLHDLEVHTCLQLVLALLIAAFCVLMRPNLMWNLHSGTLVWQAIQVAWQGEGGWFATILARKSASTCAVSAVNTSCMWPSSCLRCYGPMQNHSRPVGMTPSPVTYHWFYSIEQAFAAHMSLCRMRANAKTYPTPVRVLSI